MTNITKCDPECSDKCPKKDKCYRHTAPDGEFRSTCTFCADFTDGKECNSFWPVDKGGG